MILLMVLPPKLNNDVKLMSRWKNKMRDQNVMKYVCTVAFLENNSVPCSHMRSWFSKTVNNLSSHAMKRDPIIITLKQSKKVQPRGPHDYRCKRRSARINLLAKWCLSFFFFSFFLTIVESFINMWSHLLVKDRQKLSVTSIIVRFWKLFSHIL